MRVIIQESNQEMDIYRKTLITDFKKKTTYEFHKNRRFMWWLIFYWSHWNCCKCMDVFRKCINNELSDFFVEDYAACQEIKEALEKLKKELLLYIILMIYWPLYYFFSPRSSQNCFHFFVKSEQFQENFNKIKLFCRRFYKKLEKIVKKSEIYRTNFL